MKPKVSCEHYDRLCTIKFACCEEFWTCHRCHNSTSKCGQKNLKAWDLECIKCNRCGKVQEFPEKRPYCIECNLKFSEYFCPICKHLTGTNNKPYHCKDCGICRVNKDISFHCNTCGYCMDLSLKENHKCRPNSAHDTCFICLEPKVSCDHYDRFCTIKFACCEEFWACHRCHNSTSKCGQKNLKARDLERIKCNRCGKVQEFPEERPHCIECNLKFSDYFCPICKHLTGTNNKPYHCKDCGTCRVSKDNSFHCDICGYCMDLSLKDNHKCRPNSAHDSCFICLEDSFSGCQILPCSHKVHEDCARTMLRRGITRCPVCRESFADKMNRRPSCK